MAALVLSIAGAAAGSSVLGPVGAIVGRLVGAVAGNVIDQALFVARRNLSLEGPRLSDLTVWPRPKAQPCRASMAAHVCPAK
jgi:phage tail tape-measure protein